MNEIIIFLLILIFGFLLARLILSESNFFESASVGVLLGIGLVTFILFLTSWIGVKITYVSTFLTAIFLIFVVVLFYILLKRLGNLKNLFTLGVIAKPGLIELFFGGAIFLFVLLSFCLSTYFPVTVWDALALYDFRAKVISEYGYFVQISNQFSYFAHYPLFTSLSHVIVYLSGGSNPQFIYSMLFVSFLISFYFLLRRVVTRNISVIATFSLAILPEMLQHSTIAYTNLPYTIFYVLGIIYLYIAYLKNKNNYVLLSGILIGLSTWVRADLPFWMTGLIFALIVGVKQKKVLPIITYLIPFLIIQQTWNLFAAGLFGSDYSTSGQLSSVGASILGGLNLNRFLEVFAYLYKNVISFWGMLLPIFILAISTNLVKKDRNSLVFLSIIIFNVLGLFLGTYVFSFKVPEWKEIADSASRMSMFFPPLIIYYISIVFGDKEI